MFHKEGYQIIMTTFVITAAIAVLAEYKIDLQALKIGVQLIALVMLIWYFSFSEIQKE